MPSLQEAMDAAHLRNLEDEEIGVHFRIRNFYIPLFMDFCRERGRRPEEVRVLDCGCGNGASVEQLAAAGFQAFGIDNASLRFGQWSSRGQSARISLLMADATAIPFRDDTFDIVLSSGMLEHIGVKEECTPEYHVDPLPGRAALRSAFLAECMRVVREDGVLYIDHPNGAFFVDLWHNDYRSRPRLHLPYEKFLPSFGEVSKLAREISPGCRIEAISPAGRFTFRRFRRLWYGKLLSPLFEAYLKLLRHRPFWFLARSPLNPYLVIKVQQASGKKDQRLSRA